MARGLPAVWSGLVGLPLVAVGGYVLAGLTQYPTTAGAPLALFGAFVVGLGLYVQFVAAPDAPTMREDEQVVETRDPAQKGAALVTAAGLPLLGAGVYLLYFTTYPYVYPTVALALGLFLFSKGLLAYWTNTLTTYIVTNQRVLEEYRFLSLVRNEIPIDKVRSVEERRSPVESLVGLGNVTVRSGAGSMVTVRNVSDSTSFADVVREQL